MKLTYKIISILLVTLITFGAILYLALTTLFRERFEELERIEVIKNLDRIQNDIENEKDHLLTKTRDWAAWDDTYEFLRTHSDDYIQSNLTTESIIQLRIEGILFFNIKGELFHSMFIDRKNEVKIDIPESIKSFFSESKIFLAHQDIESSKSGIFLIEKTPYLITSLPVITSDYTGPIMGSIVFIKSINQEFINSISQRTKLDFKLEPIVAPTFNKDQTDYVYILSSSSISGVRNIKSYDNIPILRAEIKMPRDMMKEGSELLDSLMTILATSGSFLGIVFFILIKKSVTNRMLSLKNELQEIACNKNQSVLVTLSGNDELTDLARGINSTLTALNLAKKQAEEANKAKGSFLANMSHELRTPLNGVCSATELLSESNLDNDQRSLLQIINYSAKNLLSIVNDVLELSKIQAGKLSLSYTPCEIRSFTETLVKAHEISIASKQIEILSIFDPSVPKTLMVDALRLGQILNNIIGNAAKFTPSHGAIILDVSVNKIEGSIAEIKFSICDTGIGITEDKLNIIFDPFSQADGTITKKFGGTGLGLTISNMLVEMMGGSLSVVSVPDIGTRFFFTLPAQICSDALTQTNVSTDENIFAFDNHNQAPNVLLVEDNKTNQFLIERMLKKKNFKIDIANNGQEALQILDSTKFDLILMDCQMPIMDGFTATRLIREREQGTTFHIPIIALTAFVMKEDKEKCMASGMDYFVSKPIEKNKLFEAINNALSPK